MSFTIMEHTDGVPWWKASVPDRFHRCQVQTRGYIGFSRIDRCACGAIRHERGWWRERNRRKPGDVMQDPDVSLEDSLERLKASFAKFEASLTDEKPDQSA